MWLRTLLPTLPAMLLWAGCPQPADDDTVGDDDAAPECTLDDQWDAMLVPADSAVLDPRSLAMGDLDADGAADVVVLGSDPAAGLKVFRGPLAGTVDTGALLASLNAADFLVNGVVDAGRDIDGDGNDDLLIGAPWAPTGVGAIYLFEGPLAGALSLPDADATINGVSSSDEAGEAVAFAGDVDGDGLEDVIVGQRRHGDGGAAMILLAPFPETQTVTDADAVLLGPAESSTGSGVAAAGDVDGDGYDDVLVGAHSDDEAGSNAGAVFLVLGPLSGEVDLAGAALKMTAEQASEHTGRVVAGAGDLDGDGYDDIAIGASGYVIDDRDAGAVYVVYGGPSMPTGTISLADADAKIAEPSAYDNHAGGGLAGVGDVDGDGRDDLLVASAEGVYLLLGPVESAQSWSSADLSLTAPAEDGGSWWGAPVGGGLDATGDGHPDLLVASPNDDYGWTGALYLYGCEE